VDAKCASIVLADVHIIEKIELFPDKVDPRHVDKIYDLNARNQGKGKVKGDDLNIKKVSQNTLETYNLMNGLSKNLSANPSSLLSHLHIIQITISPHGWKSLGKGLGASKSIEKLIINLCEINREALMQLSEGMKTNTSIKVLNLSYNNISDHEGDLFGRIISYQTQNRDQIKWKGDLRSINQGLKGGLQELYL
jgi:hypothetical protein